MDEYNLKISEVHQASFERNMLSVAKGGGIIVIGKLFNYASRFAIVFVIARLLDAEQYGLYNLALSVASVAAGIAILGLDTALVRYVAIANSRQDEEGLWGALQIGVGLTTLLSVLTSTVLFALAYPISTQIFNEPRLAPLLQIASLIVPVLNLSEVLAGATRGFKKMHYMVIAQNFAQPLIRFVLVVVLSLIGLNVALAIITYGIADGTASILLLIFLNKRFSLKRSFHINRKDLAKILNFSIPLWLSDMMMTFKGNWQTLLLGSLNTITNVGIFSVVSHVNVIGNIIYLSTASAARPMIAELHDRGDREQMGHLYKIVTKWILMFNLPAILVMVLFPTQILSLFGKSFATGASALAILAFANLVNIGTGTCGAIIDMTGYTKLKIVNTSIRLISTVGFNLLLISLWGLIGAAVAGLLVEIVVNFLTLLEVWILFRILPYDKSFFNPLLAGLAASATAFTINQLLPFQTNLLYSGISLLAMLAVYLGVSLGLGLAPEDRLLLSRLQRRARAMFATVRSF